MLLYHKHLVPRVGLAFVVESTTSAGWLLDPRPKRAFGNKKMHCTATRTRVSHVVGGLFTVLCIKIALLLLEAVTNHALTIILLLTGTNWTFSLNFVPTKIW